MREIRKTVRQGDKNKTKVKQENFKGKMDEIYDRRQKERTQKEGKN